MERYYGDFEIGERFDTDGLTISESMILDFAMRYDPQSFHLDREAASGSFYGGLIASGTQTLAVAMRLFLSERIVHACSLGSPGMDELRFRQPVRPGDTLRLQAEILDKVPSRSKPDRGVLRIAYTLHNQRQEVVLTVKVLHLVSRSQLPDKHSLAEG